MPPKQSSGARRGRPATTSKNPPTTAEDDSSNPFESSDEQRRATSQREVHTGEDEEPESEKTIPRDLLTRLLHEFFTKDATRISKDANAATGKYFDIFVREAIARAAVEKDGGFLEVEDLEKVSPQLLLDL